MEIKQNLTFFPWKIFRFDALSFSSKNINVIMTTMNPNNGNEIKSEIFSWDIFKSDIIFHCS